MHRHAVLVDSDSARLHSQASVGHCHATGDIDATLLDNRPSTGDGQAIRHGRATDDSGATILYVKAAINYTERAVYVNAVMDECAARNDIEPSGVDLNAAISYLNAPRHLYTTVVYRDAACSHSQADISDYDATGEI